ncbi:MAG: hypothetical protein J6S67_13845 [Methanobrevibacter sp.]|nr:hypothetical protein [Methanobrevibacter sp.]
MARTVRKSTDNLEQMLQDLKIGEPPILDTESGYDITRVVSGFIYRNEYIGMCFVPDKEKPIVKNAVVKTEPKGKIEK